MDQPIPENHQHAVSIDTTPHMEAFSLFERACGCGVPSVWWHRKAPCGGVGRFRLEAKGGGVGDGHVASVASVVLLLVLVVRKLQVVLVVRTSHLAYHQHLLVEVMMVENC